MDQGLGVDALLVDNYENFAQEARAMTACSLNQISGTDCLLGRFVLRVTTVIGKECSCTCPNPSP